MTYLTEVLADAPLHFWRLAEPGGLVHYDVGSQPATLLSTGIVAQCGYSGPNTDGGSLVCIGLFGAWNIDNWTVNAPLSVEAIVFFAYLAGSTHCVVSQDNGTTPVAWVIDVSAAGLVRWADALVQLQWATPLTRGWHHVVYTLGGGTLTMYVDGVNRGSIARINFNSVGNLSTGIRTDSTSALNGAVSEVAIYGTALSAARVAAHFAAIDNIASVPIYNQAGTFSTGTGAGSAASVLLAAINTGIGPRVFQNTP
jgi:Concanavalin A-like lectin/glucanases superfamily